MGLDLDLEFEPCLLSFSILGISSGHQAIVLAWVWATLIHSGCQTRLRIVPPRRCNDSEHNRAPPCHYDAVSCLTSHCIPHRKCPPVLDASWLPPVALSWSPRFRQTRCQSNIICTLFFNYSILVARLTLSRSSSPCSWSPMYLR